MFANKNSEEYCNNGISMTKFGQLIPNFSDLKPVLVNSIFFFTESECMEHSLYKGC